MPNDLLLTLDDLAPYHPGPDPSGASHALLLQQKQTWELLRRGYESLSTVQTRTFSFDAFCVLVQFNPGRLTSSSAKVDDRSIRERKCFLCTESLPREQRGIAYGADFLILCNPFPIFPEHFTIVHRRHTPQRILGSVEALLALTRDLGGRYVLFYNGPRCGASAPDHMHFQAGTKDFMPIDLEYAAVRMSRGRTLFDRSGLRVTLIEGYLRPCFALESDSRESMVCGFDSLYGAMEAVETSPDEPMMNIIASYDGGWRLLVFPRRKHRPAFYFEEGEGRILISPAAVDLGGLCTTPLEHDFARVTSDHLVKMYDEICTERGALANIALAVERGLKKRS